MELHYKNNMILTGINQLKIMLKLGYRNLNFKTK